MQSFEIETRRKERRKMKWQRAHDANSRTSYIAISSCKGGKHGVNSG
jgi:hypothetical protein